MGNVRGPTYLEDRIKEPSRPALYDLLIADLVNVSGEEDGFECMSKAADGGVKALRSIGEERFLFIITFHMHPLYLVLIWASRGAKGGEMFGPEALGGGYPGVDLLRRFIEEMDDAERNKRLKLIPNVIGGTWVVKKAL